jgi:hypothetical protein
LKQKKTKVLFAEYRLFLALPLCHTVVSLS